MADSGVSGITKHQVLAIIDSSTPQNGTLSFVVGISPLAERCERIPRHLSLLPLIDISVTITTSYIDLN